MAPSGKKDEMIVAGVGSKLAAEMGHLPQSGDNGHDALDE
jgi:hypothetical protein